MRRTEWQRERDQRERSLTQLVMMRADPRIVRDVRRSIQPYWLSVLLRLISRSGEEI